MPAIVCKSGPWEVECLPEDGARLSRLSYKGHSLLTPPPGPFTPLPQFGAYETRPVYGYDDCFPTVDPCVYPGKPQLFIPDHGELCWLPWQVEPSAGRLDCSVESRLLPLQFRRTLVFGADALRWQFEVRNDAEETLHFLHVMHALMLPAQIGEIHLPDCASLYDETRAEMINREPPPQLARNLLATPRGTARMLLLRGVREQSVGLVLRNGLALRIESPTGLFPTLGIWWNNSGYPPIAGRERSECAFEPVPGTASSLLESSKRALTLSVSPGGRTSWSVLWKITAC